MDYQTMGTHIMIDMWGVDFDLLNNVDGLEGKMYDAALSSGAGVLGVQSEGFVPQGCTILLLLSESHFSIHTYPEQGYASIDCYTCGEGVDPKVAIEMMIDFLQPKKLHGKEIKRGNGEFAVNDYTGLKVSR
ncbi:adenosylmethionine decarboxylase [Litchfieldia salsa]|uniref:S-adenosylmethionine decarboxylase proenzyme n=1 Tax=Litchfieldia salsa TaxID=930152 RepID=A0A1H0U0P6_9BACI|nr:adenosylmethionine decarboxylase [Litchfieldia salsa]SDP59711.1 adenosylmethionine decarboxylase proenzyme [Litchfieldia salsa]